MPTRKTPITRRIRVAVFYDDSPRLRVRWGAYTNWYSPTWPGCCMHEVEAKNGTEAKKLAIAECKAHRGL
jgi:hypothetical protein